jgi:pyruvate dehydrogenase E2 component (dihydrolipoamide acetyltransferase)
MGVSEESAVLTAWYVRQGEAVAAGALLFALETGKSCFDVQAEHAGVVLSIIAAEGDEVPVGAPVCVIGEPGEAHELPAAAEKTPTPERPQTPAPFTAPPERPQAPAVPAAGVSPRARGLAAKLRVDPARAVPSGPGGRVIERDIRALPRGEQPAPPAPKSAASSYEDIPLTNMRKLIAKNMTASLQNAAQLTHTASFCAARILALREEYKKNPATAGITLTDIIVHALARELPAHPALNAHLLGDTLRVFREVNIAVAVDTERGLMVPVLFNAAAKTLPELSRELKALAEACRKGSIAPALLSGGSFTVSNLGQYGIESFTPILNPPQTGILGVCAITNRVRVTEDGCIGAQPRMTLCLTYDHRAIDGAPASRFLQALCRRLEDYSPEVNA